MGSVQCWTCPVPASNVPGVATATAASGSSLPSTPPPVQHLPAIPSPHYNHPLAAKPSCSLPRRHFLPGGPSALSPLTASAACHPRLWQPLDKPTYSPDTLVWSPTHHDLCHRLPKPLQPLPCARTQQNSNRTQHFTKTHSTPQPSPWKLSAIQTQSDLPRSFPNFEPPLPSLPRARKTSPEFSCRLLPRRRRSTNTPSELQPSKFPSPLASSYM